jgi:GDP-L-fucose synthase
LNNIIILGGTGFVGKNLVNKLSQIHNTNIHILSKSNGCNFLDFESLQSTVKSIQPDIIFNCAAHTGSVHYVGQNAATVITDNIQIITNIYKVLASSCNSTKIINIISNCSYPGDSLIQEESQWLDGPPHNSVISYAAPKRLLYYLALCYKKQYNINSINWISPNCYGPLDHLDPNKVHALNGIIIRMIECKKNNSPTFEIWGSGQPKREWIYVEDLAEILIKSIDITEQIYPVNIGQNKSFTIIEIANIISQTLNYNPKLQFNLKFTDGDPIKQLDDKQFRMLYSNFEFTDLSKGIEKTINYYWENIYG